MSSDGIPTVREFNIVFGSPAELAQRERHRDLLRGLTKAQAASEIMLLNVCNAAERVYGGISEFAVVTAGADTVVHLPWYKPYQFTENDMDILRLEGSCDGKTFGLFVGSTEKLLYESSTVLDQDGGEWRLATHSSLRIRPGRACKFASVCPSEDTALQLSEGLWTLYSILEVLKMRLWLLSETDVPVDELTPHSETDIFDLSLLTREFIELVVFIRAGGGVPFSTKTGYIQYEGFSLDISDDGGSFSISLSNGYEEDAFTSWYCQFLQDQLHVSDASSITSVISNQEAVNLAKIDPLTPEVERLRRLMIVHQSSMDDEKWRALQAVIIHRYLATSSGAHLQKQIDNELASEGENFALAVTDELEDVLEDVLPDVRFCDETKIPQARLEVGIMHMANYRYRSVSENKRLCGAWFGPGRGLELTMPQSTVLRVKIKDEKFVLRLKEGGLMAETDGLYSKLVRVLNQLPEISVLDTGIGRPNFESTQVNSAWIANLILAGKAGIEKAIWLLRAIYNGLVEVDLRSSRAGYIPKCFKSEGRGLRIEQHLCWKVAVKLCYLTDGSNVFLVKDHEASEVVSLTRKSPSSMEGSDKYLDHAIGEGKYRSVALLSKCKLR